jgi:AcrR family transcriptional regulator
VAKSRSAADAQAAILQAAYEVFAAHGLAGSRMQEIAQRAGASQGLIYHYFRDKETLWDAVAAAKLKHYLDALEAHASADATQDLWARFVHRMRFAMQYALAHPQSLRLRIWSALGGLSSRSQPSHELSITPQIAELQRAGLVRTDAPAEQLAEYVSVCGRGWLESKIDGICYDTTDPRLQPGDVHWLELMLEGLRPRRAA